MGGNPSLSFLLITFPSMSLLPQRLFLDSVQKVGKKVDIHFFENIVSEKFLPVYNLINLIFDFNFLFQLLKRRKLLPQ